MSEQLDRAAVARLVGLRPGTLGTLRRRGKMPEPDGHIGRSPWWSKETIEAWMTRRAESAAAFGAGRRWPTDPGERKALYDAERSAGKVRTDPASVSQRARAARRPRRGKVDA